MTYRAALDWGASELQQTSSSPELDALLLLSHCLDQDKTTVLAHPEAILTAPMQTQYRTVIQRRADYEPLAYIVGMQEFYSLDFIVDPRVLVPRPETEAFIDFTQQAAPADGRLIDIGTGSGCIAVTIKKLRPDLTVFASDIDPEALVIAQQNALRYDVDITFKHSDLLQEWTQEKFDLILANLPYVPTKESTSKTIEHEPEQSLFAGRDGLQVYREFIPQTVRCLSSNGVVVIEHLPSQQDGVDKIARLNGLNHELVSPFVSTLSSNR